MSVPTDSAVGPETQNRSRRHSHSAPISALVGLLTGLLVLGSASVPLRDTDLYWHLLAGRDLASGTSPLAVGEGWSFADDRPWASTQWLAELALYGIHQVGGWAALAAFRVVTLAVVLGILGWTTLRGRPALLASGPFLFAAFSVWLSSEERPQQVTYIGAAVLGGVLLTGVTKGNVPRWWVLLPLTLIWANVHGGWVLVPGVMALIGLGRLVDRGRARWGCPPRPGACAVEPPRRCDQPCGTRQRDGGFPDLERRQRHHLGVAAHSPVQPPGPFHDRDAHDGCSGLDPLEECRPSIRGAGHAPAVGVLVDGVAQRDSRHAPTCPPHR